MKKPKKRSIAIANHLILQQQEQIARLKNRVMELTQDGYRLRRWRDRLSAQLSTIKRDPNYQFLTPESRRWNKRTLKTNETKTEGKAIPQAGFAPIVPINHGSATVTA